MRALRWPDAFPAADLGLLKAAADRSPAELAKAAGILAALAVPTRPCSSGTSPPTSLGAFHSWIRLVVYYRQLPSPIGKLLLDL